MEEGQYVHKKIEGIEFGFFSPKLIKKLAVAKVVTPELYDKEGYPVDGGLMDIRLGVIDPGLVCKTDGLRLKESLGHFGYIALARPVIHISYVPVVLSMLRNTCRETSRILIPESKMKEVREHLLEIGRTKGSDAMRKRLTELVKQHKKNNKQADYPKARQYPVTLEKPTTFLENERRLSPIEIRSRLEKISDEDAELFGLNPSAVRPEWLILTVFLIPSVTMRPSITLETGERSEDDLTHKLGDIVRINQRLFENINAGAPEIIVEDLWDLLQYHVTTFIDNEVAQLPPARHRSGQPLKTISERIRSKEGRIRHNLVGKRTNFSARTVISPDPMLELNEVGVPDKMATKLTVPERVTEWNMDYLKTFVKRGPKEYPGANYVIRPDGAKKKLTEDIIEATLEELQPGFIVERHLMDGDIAIFNRQPSLHRMSMMCHKVRVLPCKTLRLNPAVCFPYNADFDGDEMNLHIPQSEEARVEAELLMLVQTQLISPRYGLSVIGAVQDAISGNYLLTRKKTVMKYEEAIDLLVSIGVTDFSRLSRKAKVSGKEVFSALLPKDFSFKGTSRSKEESDVVITNGQLTEGVMDKNNLGEGSGLMLRNLHKKYAETFTVDLLGKIFRLGIAMCLKRGFTTSIADTDLPQEAKDRIDEVFKHSDEEVSSLISEFNAGRLEPFPGRSTRETLELKIMEVLNRARNETGHIVAKYANPKSHTLIMANSGARGTLLNLAQIAGSVGQQALRGKRIEKGFKDRTLSYFRQNDLGSEARGFIRSSFRSGLSPAEFFFQAMVGRDSLMDTALRTPKSGYLYRRLSNALQDLHAEYDGTVRDGSGKIVQFNYGEDGIDVSRSEGGKINVNRVLKEAV